MIHYMLSNIATFYRVFSIIRHHCDVIPTVWKCKQWAVSIRLSLYLNNGIIDHNFVGQHHREYYCTLACCVWVRPTKHELVDYYRIPSYVLWCKVWPSRPDPSRFCAGILSQLARRHTTRECCGTSRSWVGNCSDFTERTRISTHEMYCRQPNALKHDFSWHTTSRNT